jgi:radical SAM protein with 4Fe4S-binding SPASM domain
MKERGLNEIWKDMQKSELIKKVKDFSMREGSCMECKYLYECGGCRSRTFALTGDWRASDPSCPLRGK